jgi:succinate-semialdehyde dehydrogenase/glutarate-semialdehyde dehydrogenase
VHRGAPTLFFRVPEEAAAIALANETGMVFINSAAASTPDLPFGGVKNSGYGHELSGAGIQEFVNKKLIRVS